MSDRQQPPRNSTHWQGVVFGVALGALAAYQFFKLPPVLPMLTQTYGYGRAYTGGLMSVYSVAGLLLSWSVGRTCSRYGPRGLLLATFGVTSGIIPTCLFALPAALPGSGVSASRGFAALMTGETWGSWWGRCCSTR